MNIKNFIEKKSLGFYIGLGVFLLTLISLVMYFVFGVKNGHNVLIIVLLFVALAAQAVYCFFDIDYLPLLPVVSLGASAFMIIKDNVGSFADYFNEVGLFGDATQIPFIVTLFIFFLVGALAAIVACFFRMNKKAVA